jgi:hypothetical protein
MSKKNKITNFLIGTDPEFFLYSEEKNKYIPVCGLVGGTKDNPLPIATENKGFSLQEDNVCVEFTIPPVNNIEDWVNNINFVKNYVNETILKPKNLLPMYYASARFELEDLQSKQAQTMGCDVSYNAWSFEPHKVDRSDKTLRTAGFHIHVGYDRPDMDVSVDLIRAMDLFIGVPSVLLDPDTERRKMYGKAGDYRIKPYGTEYRPLSAYFLSDDELLRWVYNSTLKAIEFVNFNGIITNPDDIINCINNSDKNLAMSIMEDYNIEVLNFINANN